MKSVSKHPVRVGFRFLWMMAELGFGLVLYLPWRLVHWSRPTRQVRARWLQHTCRRLLKIFRAELQVSGPVPTHGLVACNHLTYIDIMVICAVTPVVFVAKREVRTWPVFGWFAILAGSVFIDRERRSAVVEVAAAVESALQEGVVVVLFPEGTSSDGTDVLPFKPSLLQPVVQLKQPVAAARIGYALTDGDVRNEVCYWGDMTLMPHLLNLFAKASLTATLRFNAATTPCGDRKALARQLHAEVRALGVGL